MIGRQVHHERRPVAGEQGPFEHYARTHGHRDADQVKGEHHAGAAAREKGRREECVDGKPRATGHERRHRHGQDPLALSFQGTRRHDRWDVAAEPDDQGHKRLARQADFPHQAVHQEGGAGHVARILHDGEEEIKEADDGNESGDQTNAAAHPIGEDYVEPHGRAGRRQERPSAVDEERTEGNVEDIDESAAEIDGAKEHQIHGAEEDQGTHPSVENQPVDSIGNRRPALRACSLTSSPAATTAAHRFGGEGMGERIAPIGEGGVRLLHGSRFYRRRAPLAGRAVEGPGQFSDPLAVDGGHGNHRAPQAAAQVFVVDLDPGIARPVHHVEGDHHGHSHLE